MLAPTLFKLRLRVPMSQEMNRAEEFRTPTQAPGPTGEALAKALGVDARTVRRWEQDENTKAWRKVPEPVLRLMRLWADPRLPKVLRPKT
jgi:transcriptional regulator with XRE-family HTH domain